MRRLVWTSAYTCILRISFVLTEASCPAVSPTWVAVALLTSPCIQHSCLTPRCQHARAALEPMLHFAVASLVAEWAGGVFGLAFLRGCGTKRGYHPPTR